ncbi:MAG: YbhB/YbcL family Raf kinase inhibitor-like protein [Candidatus Kaiserbacteria bacterium]|nr:MAG: YbhB/YbcL family Raf kinase inhibitor-like protein [Candidatus Kaiserbacteria bacterium]
MTNNLTLSSAAFAHEASIPSEYTCDGKGTSPPLSISGVPEGTKSLALIADDPDVPKQLKPDGVFDHWVLFNIPPTTVEIPAGGSAGTAGANGAGNYAYTGPCPPPQYEPSEHRYFFTLYALDAELPLAEGASKQEVLAAMAGHMIQETQLMGKYKRQ